MRSPALGETVVLGAALAALVLAHRRDLALLLFDENLDAPVRLELPLQLQETDAEEVRATRRAAVDARLSSTLEEDPDDEDAHHHRNREESSHVRSLIAPPA